MLSKETASLPLPFSLWERSRGVQAEAGRWKRRASPQPPGGALREETREQPLNPLIRGPEVAVAGAWLRGDQVSPASAGPEPRPPPMVQRDSMGEGGFGPAGGTSPGRWLTAGRWICCLHFGSWPARSHGRLTCPPREAGGEALGLRSLREKQTAGGCTCPGGSSGPSGLPTSRLARGGDITADHQQPEACGMVFPAPKPYTRLLKLPGTCSRDLIQKQALAGAIKLKQDDTRRGRTPASAPLSFKWPLGCRPAHTPGEGQGQDQGQAPRVTRGTGSEEAGRSLPSSLPRAAAAPLGPGLGPAGL